MKSNLYFTQDALRVMITLLLLNPLSFVYFFNIYLFLVNVRVIESQV